MQGSIIDKPPILFRRFPHQKAQTHPQKGGRLGSVLSLINVKDKGEQILLQAYLVAGVIPGYPHPVLVTHGPQGSAKTTVSRIIKELLDPSQLKTATAHSNIREFVQLASHHWVLILDNLSNLSEWLSDAISRACTGEGFSKRELYTDDEDFIYNFQRIIGLNGINLVVEKPDLLDRSLLLGLERIPDKQRIREKDLWTRFEDMKPHLLGAIFDAVSGAIQRIESIELPSYPRMADFARWGCAVVEALGYSQSDFLDAYSQNIGFQHDEAIEASPVGLAVMGLMSQHDEWGGSPTELLDVLEIMANSLKIDLKAKAWPKDANMVWKRINEVHSNLSAKGIKAHSLHSAPKCNILKSKQGSHYWLK